MIFVKIGRGYVENISQYVFFKSSLKHFYSIFLNILIPYGILII